MPLDISPILSRIIAPRFTSPLSKRDSATASLLSAFLLGVAIFSVAASPARAADPDEPWRLRVAGIWVDPSSDFEDGDLDTAIDGDGDLGVSVALERRISRRFGVEFGALYTDTGLNFEFTPIGIDPLTTNIDTDLRMLTAALNFHLTPDRKTDIYVGPVFAYLDFGDVQFQQSIRDQTISAELRGSDDFAFGAQIGADIPVGDGPWGLNLSARYIDSTLGLALGEAPEIQYDYDPLILGVGFSFSF